ncbi:dTDP-4-dehydrorhamnose 3,5-epimerase [Candidatus Rubidus massiliensis]|nr:dTDP-4-dehydrorhamnose 3,5-epimerase [Candidatus Rubidus massiliensis]
MNQDTLETTLLDAKLIQPKIYGDERGFFFESFNARDFKKNYGIDELFVQDNHSRSPKNVLRGLHYQIHNAQGKLVRVVSGQVYDVIVDLRHSSSTFGKWQGFYLSAENKTMLYIPPGFAHGFLVMSEYADFLYKTTNYYDPSAERSIIWNDKDLAIEWPLEVEPILSAKDKNGTSFKEAEKYQ